MEATGFEKTTAPTDQTVRCHKRTDLIGVFTDWEITNASNATWLLTGSNLCKLAELGFGQLN
jgi:hypothetical protein